MIKKYIQYIKENQNDEYLEEEDEDEDDDYDFITDKKFRQFLIDNKCLYGYLHNCHEYENKVKLYMHQHIYFIKEFDKQQELNYIMNAFDWDKTPEGEKFWDIINDKWVKLLKSDDCLDIF